MPCIEDARLAWGRVALSVCLVLLVGACASTRPPSAPASPPTSVVPAQPPAPAAPPAQPLARDWKQYHRLAAQRLVAANPDRTYTGRVPEPLKGIPVLEVELHGDGSVRKISVQRRPRPADAQHTTQLAIDAVRRAAPFPPVAHLPKPWTYTEVFLFQDDDRFKPRTLDD